MTLRLSGFFTPDTPRAVHCLQQVSHERSRRLWLEPIMVSDAEHLQGLLELVEEGL
jgi:hypothetical protein